MPHKHKRKQHVGSTYDLPPSVRATALPVGKAQSTTPTAGPRTRKTRKGKQNLGDDTPKAFARMMRWQKAGQTPNGLDDGAPKRNSSTKKRKRGADDHATATTNSSTAASKTDSKRGEMAAADVPTLLPGERLADYAARVDRALPVAGLTTKGKKVAGIKEKRTKHDRRLQRLQAEWRKEEARLKEKEEEEQEKEEEEKEEREAQYGSVDKLMDEAGQNGGRRGKKKKRLIGETKDQDDDPWAVLKERREQPKGLHDVVQAPPEFKKLPKERFKVRDGAKVQVMDVPNAAGSLRQREELSETRKEIIERYRQMMHGKKG